MALNLRKVFARRLWFNIELRKLIMRKKQENTKLSWGIKVLSSIQIALYTWAFILHYQSNMSGKGQVALVIFVPFLLFILLAVINAILAIKYIVETRRHGVRMDKSALSLLLVILLLCLLYSPLAHWVNTAV